MYTSTRGGHSYSRYSASQTHSGSKMNICASLSLAIVAVSASPHEYVYQHIPYYPYQYMLAPQVPSWFVPYKAPDTQPIQIDVVDATDVIDVCKGREGMFANKGNECLDYYVCVAWVDGEELKAWRFTCNPGLYFSEKNKKCDWPENIVC